MRVYTIGQRFETFASYLRAMSVKSAIPLRGVSKAIARDRSDLALKSLNKHCHLRYTNGLSSNSFYRRWYCSTSVTRSRNISIVIVQYYTFLLERVPLERVPKAATAKILKTVEDSGIEVELRVAI